MTFLLNWLFTSIAIAIADWFVPGIFVLGTVEPWLCYIFTGLFLSLVNSLVKPIITVLGLQLASAFAGAILTESIFSWPGLGTLIVNSVNSRDYALIQGIVLFSAVVFVFVNLVVDIVYTIINPKVNYSGGGEA